MQLALAHRPLWDFSRDLGGEVAVDFSFSAPLREGPVPSADAGFLDFSFAAVARSMFALTLDYTKGILRRMRENHEDSFLFA